MEGSDQTAVGNMCVRAITAVAVVALLFFLRWDFDRQHFDWQVWEAANAILGEGGNPYDDAVLNAEIASDPEAYGSEHFGGDENSRLFLVNPPTWVLTVKALASSAFLASFIGALAMVAAIVLFTRNRPIIQLIGALSGFFLFNYLGGAATTFAFGQTGFVVGGLIGVYLLLVGRQSSGIALALLAMKPHLAFGAGIGHLASARDRRAAGRTLLAFVAPFAFLALVSAIVFGPEIWLEWVSALMGEGAQPVSTLADVSLGTLSEAVPWRDLGLFGVFIGLALASALAYFCRDGDPRATVFATVAISAYLSGHAFIHDWLWLPLVPAALGWDTLRWSPALALLGLGAALAPRFVSNSVGFSQSAAGLVITLGLTAVAIASRRKENEDPSEVDDVAELVVAEA